MISVLVGLQAGYVQYACFLCQWRSRAKDQYDTSNWPLRQAYTTGFQNIQYNPLVTTDKICLPPIHIKLGIFKTSLKPYIENQNNLNVCIRFFQIYQKQN